MQMSLCKLNTLSINISHYKYFFIFGFIFVNIISPLKLFAETKPYRVTVNFEQQEPSRNLSGFLGTFSEDLIADQHIRPLKPALMNVGDLKQMERAQGLGLEPYVLLSSYWGYPGIAAQFRLSPPYKDIDAWKNTIRSVVKEFGPKATYYVWNEPDMPIFFGMWLGSSKENFYKVFRAAHDVIREELGSSARISGPTFSFLSSDFEGFMNYAKENNLQVDVLSFHLLYQKDLELKQTMEQVKLLRKKYIDAGNAFESVGVKEIHINEYLRADRQNSRPGSILNFIREMEQAGVDKASRACWGDPSIPCVGASCMLTYFVAEWVSPGTCRDGSINGLLDKNKQPRASWWAHKYYADGVAFRVQATSSSPGINVLASSKTDQGDVAQVIVVFTEKIKKSSSIYLDLQNLNALTFISKNDSNIKYSIKRIPYSGSGAKAVEKLTLLEEGVLTINDSHLEIKAEHINQFEALVIEISSSN